MAATLRRRKFAEQLLASGSNSDPVQSPWQGVNRIAQALIGGWMARDADQEAKAYGEKLDGERKASSAILERLMGGPMPQPSGQAAMLMGQPASTQAGSQAPSVGASFTARNLPAGIDPETDQIVRTVYGEARGEGADGQRAVASVIRNRARQSGMNTTDVIFAPNQFEPWGNPATRKQLEALDPQSPEYQAILANIRPTLTGQAPDPTGGADHFYSPKAQAALGRSAPSWAAGDPSAVIGGHNFYSVGYRPGAAARTGGVDVAGPGAPAGAPPMQAQPDFSQALNQAQQFKAYGAWAMNNDDPRIRQQGQIALQQADTIERRVEAERVRAETRTYQQQNLEAQREIAAANRNAGTLPAGYARGPDGSAVRIPGVQVPSDPRTDLMQLAPKVANGTATPEEMVRYSVAATDYTKPQYVNTERGLMQVPGATLPPGFPPAPQLGGQPQMPQQAQPQMPPQGAQQGAQPPIMNADPNRPVQPVQAPQQGMQQPPQAMPPQMPPQPQGAPPAAPQGRPMGGGAILYPNEGREPPSAIVTGMLDGASSLRKVDDALGAIRENPDAVGPSKMVQIGPIANWWQPGGAKARALVADIGSLKIHDRSGAAVSAKEFPRLQPFIPEISDTPQVAETKLRNFRREYLSLLRDQYNVYGPAAGYRALGPVEDALKGADPTVRSAQPSMDDVQAELRRRGLVK
ncbi:MAG: cell wall hydrolase [Bradyrhizobium sp.]|uniref:cell wall hydrolase n=1 Tax=Bradyrhizobium sp. TaxID=376 RepID=UPI003D12B417